MSNDQDDLENTISRRNFLQRAGTAALVAGSSAPVIGGGLGISETLAASPRPVDTGKKLPMRAADSGTGDADVRRFLEPKIYTRDEIRNLLDEKLAIHARYDGELGWTLKDGRFADGIDGSVSTYRYDANGARIMINGRDGPCRINTYGDSFTQCGQVSDGETWQEFLAAHLGEGIRNFGVGSYSVYQAYLRMLREEAKSPAECIIFTIYDDDHYRNLCAWQGIRNDKVRHSIYGPVIWMTSPSIQVDLTTGACHERRNPCPTRDDLYKLTDLDWVYETFKDEFDTEIMMTHLSVKEKNPNRNYDRIIAMAKTHGVNTDTQLLATLSTAANELHTKAALRASTYVIGKVEEFAQRTGKKILYVLCPSSRAIPELVQKGKRFDQEFLDFLTSRRLAYVDLLEEHRRNFVGFSLGVEDYVARYYIPHHTPLGNYFFAHAIKAKLLALLDPKPPAYRKA